MMLMKRIVSVLAVVAVFGLSVCGVSPVYSGGIKMPETREESADPASEAEPLQKMPAFEYEESKMPVDEQPAAEVKEKTWVWVLLGFAGALFLTNL
jgi:hypothetical protein